MLLGADISSSQGSHKDCSGPYSIFQLGVGFPSNVSVLSSLRQPLREAGGPLPLLACHQHTPPGVYTLHLATEPMSPFLKSLAGHTFGSGLLQGRI